MADVITNKTVVITGGAEGIGYEIADKYLQKRAKVVIILDVNEKKGKEAVSTLTKKYGSTKCVFLKCDVTKDLDNVSKKITDEFKNIDVLVNNAGILNDTLIKKTIEVNVTALIEWSLKIWDHMRKDKGGNGGTIINLASIYGFRVDQFLPTYQASKFAVMGFTKSLGHNYNYKRTGVRVIAICPGFTRTSLTSVVNTLEGDEQLRADADLFFERQLWQDVGAVGNAAVEIFENAYSGTAWLIEGNKPISEVN